MRATICYGGRSTLPVDQVLHSTLEKCLRLAVIRLHPFHQTGTEGVEAALEADGNVLREETCHVALLSAIGL